MPHRLGKIRVFTAEGKLIREGYAREADFQDPKIFKYFTMSELIRAGVLVIICAFTLGGLWMGINNRFEIMSKDVTTFINTFTAYKEEQNSFHKTIFDRLDAKENRINCLAESMSRCCPASQNC